MTLCVFRKITHGHTLQKRMLVTYKQNLLTGETVNWRTRQPTRLIWTFWTLYVQFHPSTQHNACRTSIEELSALAVLREYLFGVLPETCRSVAPLSSRRSSSNIHADSYWCVQGSSSDTPGDLPRTRSFLAQYSHLVVSSCAQTASHFQLQLLGSLRIATTTK